MAAKGSSKADDNTAAHDGLELGSDEEDGTDAAVNAEESGDKKVVDDEDDVWTFASRDDHEHDDL